MSFFIKFIMHYTKLLKSLIILKISLIQNAIRHDESEVAQIQFSVFGVLVLYIFKATFCKKQKQETKQKWKLVCQFQRYRQLNVVQNKRNVSFNWLYFKSVFGSSGLFCLMALHLDFHSQRYGYILKTTTTTTTTNHVNT